MNENEVAIVLVLMQISGTIIAILAGFVLSRMLDIISRKDSYFFQKKMTNSGEKNADERIRSNEKILKENEAYNFLYRNISSIRQKDDLMSLIKNENFELIDYDFLIPYYDEYKTLIDEAEKIFLNSKKYSYITFDEFLLHEGMEIDKKSTKYDVYTKSYFINVGQYQSNYNKQTIEPFSNRPNCLPLDIVNHIKKQIEESKKRKKILKIELNNLNTALAKIRKTKNSLIGVLVFITMMAIGLFIPLLAITGKPIVLTFSICFWCFCAELLIAIGYFIYLLKESYCKKELEYKDE